MRIVIITENPDIEVITDADAQVVLVRADDLNCVELIKPTVDPQRTMEYLDDAR
jgi:hypothetical protein